MKITCKYFITDSYQMTLETAMIYFNKNSLRFLSEQKLERHLDIRFKRSRVILLTLRNWVYQMLSIDERDKLLICGSAILYIYGLRGCNDIDIYYAGPSNQHIIRFLANPETKFSYIDCMIPGTEYWPDYRADWEQEFAELIGIKDYMSIVEDPSNHFYYMGLKFMDLNIDIARRYVRKRISSITDMIMMQRILERPIIMPKMKDIEEKNDMISKEVIDKIDNKIRMRYWVEIGVDEIARILEINRI